MKYRFIRAVMVDGVKVEGGTVVAEGELPAGTLESLRFVGHVVEHHEAPDVGDTPAAPPTQPPAKVKAAKK